MGHEFVGQIVEIGSEVKHLKEGISYKDGTLLNKEYLDFQIGQRVTVQPRLARYKDGLMLMKDPIQNLSYDFPGAFAQYIRIPAGFIQGGAVIRIPDSVSDEQAALVEPAGCALESIFTTPHSMGIDREGRHIMKSGIKEGGNTLIVGSGVLALIYGRLALAEKAHQLWFQVRSQKKADLIQGLFGNDVKIKIVADYSGNDLEQKLLIEQQLVKEYQELTDGQFFDDLILACASMDSQRLLFNISNEDGYSAIAFFAGLHDLSDRTNVDLLHFRLAKAFGSSGASTQAMQTILDWIAAGKLSLEGLSSNRKYTLNDDPAQFFTMGSENLKPLLYPNN
jgi:L-iditol 2-dehydrogenase